MEKLRAKLHEVSRMVSGDWQLHATFSADAGASLRRARPSRLYAGAHTLRFATDSVAATVAMNHSASEVLLTIDDTGAVTQVELLVPPQYPAGGSA